MRVLMVHNDYGRPSGEERAVENLSDLLREAGHDVLWFRRSSEVIGGSFIRKAGAFFTGIYSRGSRRSFADLLDAHAVDVVFVQNLFPFISPSILPVCKARRIPVVMRCPNYRLFCPSGTHLSHGRLCERCVGGREWHCVVRNCEGDYAKSLGYAARSAFARATAMILDNVDVFAVLSDFQRRKFVERGIPEQRIRLLFNVAPTVDRPVADEMGESVVFVGRPSEEKGFREFIACARRLPEVPFAVAGDPAQALTLVGEVPSNVRLAGFLTGSDLSDFYASSRIVVAPSTWWEGFPNTIVEAMAHARPVVSSRLGSIPEIVDDGITGLLCEPGDSEHLTERIVGLWAHPGRCLDMGRAGYDKAKRRYSPDRVYQQLCESLRNAMEGAPSNAGPTAVS